MFRTLKNITKENTDENINKKIDKKRKAKTKIFFVKWLCMENSIHKFIG